MSRTELPDLTRILDAQERLAPDVDAVRVGITRGIRRRRNRRRIGYVAGAVAAFALIAASLAVIRPTHPRPDDGTTATPGRTLKTDDFRNTIRVGWLPAALPVSDLGAVDDTVETFRAASVGDNGMYSDLGLSIQIFTRSWQPPTTRPDWTSTTVNGRPGWLTSTPSSTYVDWQMPSGRWASLWLGSGFPDDVPGPGPHTQPGLETDARRVAASVTEGPGRPVPTGITLTYLPSRLTITGVGPKAADGCGSIQVSTGAARVVGTRQGRTTDLVETYAPDIAPREQFTISCGDWNQAVNNLSPWEPSNEVVEGRAVYRSPVLKSVVVGGLDGDLAAVVQGPPIDSRRSPAVGGPSMDEVVKLALGVRRAP